MVKLMKTGVYYMEGKLVKEAYAFMTSDKKEKALKRTVTYSVLKAHGGAKLTIDVETAERVPARLASASRYAAECVFKSGQTGLVSGGASCSGALGALVLRADAEEVQSEGGKITLSGIETVAVFLKGKLRKGVGPFDLALSIIAATKKSGFLKGKILEFVGTGVSSLSAEYRIAVDGYLKSTLCLATVWETDGKTREFLEAHGRAADYKELKCEQPAYFDGGVSVDLARVEPMIELPYLKANIYELKDFLSRPEELLSEAEEAGEKALGEKPDLLSRMKGGKVYSGGARVLADYETAAEVAEIMRGKSVGTGEFFLALSPVSQAVYKGLADNGYLSLLAAEGVTVCEPNSVGPAARFFMDARTLAATALNGGAVASALGTEFVKRVKKYKFDGTVYADRKD